MGPVGGRGFGGSVNFADGKTSSANMPIILIVSAIVDSISSTDEIYSLFEYIAYWILFWFLTPQEK